METTMGSTAKVIIKRACCIGGERIEPEAVLRVDPLLALDLVELGRADLADPDELPELHRARTDATRAALKLAAAPADYGPPVDDRWLRRA
jgi:hypothetical protein